MTCEKKIPKRSPDDRPDCYDCHRPWDARRPRNNAGIAASPAKKAIYDAIQRQGIIDTEEAEDSKPTQTALPLTTATADAAQDRQKKIENLRGIQ